MPAGRRAFLTSIGAAATGLAGCLDGGESPGSPTRTSTANPSDTAAPDAVTLGDSVSIDGVTVTVSTLVAAHSVRYLSAPDAIDVISTSDDQFAFVDVSVDEGSSPPRRFWLVADGTSYGPGIEGLGPARADAPVTGRRYGESTPQGFLDFRVPAPLDAESVAVVLGGDGPERTDVRPGPADVVARWSVPSAAATPLRSPPPAFSSSVDAPDSVPATEPIPVTLTVTNEGDGPGVFRAAINHQGPRYGVAVIDRSLAAGESITHEATVDYYLDDDTTPGRVQFAVVGPNLSEFFEVSLDGGGTPAGTGTATGASR